MSRQQALGRGQPAPGEVPRRACRTVSHWTPRTPQGPEGSQWWGPRSLELGGCLRAGSVSEAGSARGEVRGAWLCPPPTPPWRSVGHRCAPTSRGHRLPGVRAAVAWPGGAAPHPTVPSSPDSSGGSARSWVLDCRRRHAPSCRTGVPQGRGVCREFWRVSWAGRQGFSDPFQGTLSYSGQHGGQSSPGSGFPRSRERPGKVGGAGSLPVRSGAPTHLLWPLPFGLLPSAGGLRLQVLDFHMGTGKMAPS